MKNQITDDISNFFLALADRTRLRLLNVMRGREVNVTAFVEILGESQPKISRHLAFLRSAGIVELRRDGKWIHYKIVENENDFAALSLQNTLDWLDSQEEMRNEYERFLEFYGLAEETLAAQKPAKSNTFASTNVNKNKANELQIHLL